MFDADSNNYKLEFDFGDDGKADEAGAPVDFSGQESLGPCPRCGAPVYEHGSNYVCSKSVPTSEQPVPSCDFKSGKIILQQPVERAQMQKLLATGKTDLLDKFISTRTRRPFKAHLAWDKDAGKVGFEFAPSKFPPRAGATSAAGASKSGAASAGAESAGGQKGSKSAGAKTTAKTARRSAPKTTKTTETAAKTAPKTAAKSNAAKTPRAPAAGRAPSPELAAVIGPEPVARTEALKKVWDYIKAHGLQDATNKRAINADAKLQPLFGKPQISMFELAGILGKHLG